MTQNIFAEMPKELEKEQSPSRPLKLKPKDLIYVKLLDLLREAQAIGANEDRRRLEMKMEEDETYVYRESPIRENAYKEIIEMLRHMRVEEVCKIAPKKYDILNMFRLSQPPFRYYFVESPLPPDRPVSLAALKYKITPRIKRLAEPTLTCSIDERKNPSKPPKAALEYKATPRIIQLAKPRKRTGFRF